MLMLLALIISTVSGHMSSDLARQFTQAVSEMEAREVSRGAASSSSSSSSGCTVTTNTSTVTGQGWVKVSWKGCKVGQRLVPLHAHNHPPPLY